MNVQVTTRHFNGSPELQANIKSLVEKVSRFNDTLDDVHVILEAEKKNLRNVEIIMKIHDKTICATSSGENMHRAVELAFLKATRLLKKEKQKLKGRRTENISQLVA